MKKVLVTKARLVERNQFILRKAKEKQLCNGYSLQANIRLMGGLYSTKEAVNGK